MADRDGPGRPLAAWRRSLRYWLSRVVVVGLVGVYVRLTIEGRDRVPPGPVLYCFNHLSWTDPFVVIAALPRRPRLFIFGPATEDMRVGTRNRVMAWTGTAVPFRPGRRGLRDAVRTVEAIFAAGSSLAIAGEGRIHVREADLLPLDEGGAFLALRAGVPLVPVAINGTSWLRFRRRVRVRIGAPVPAGDLDPARRDAVPELNRRLWLALHALVEDHPDLAPTRGFGGWLSGRFNDWLEGSREAADEARQAVLARSGGRPSPDAGAPMGARMREAPSAASGETPSRVPAGARSGLPEPVPEPRDPASGPDPGPA
jgi:1-acyl-sn-glycerol-3-phosphate acyltransferase